MIVPAGQGGLLLGLARGFDALRVANMGKERAEKEDVGKKRAQGEKPETETKKARKDKLLKGIFFPDRLGRKGSLLAGSAPGQDVVPRLIGVQARACAPLWALFTAGMEGLRFVAENPTLAEGVKVPRRCGPRPCCGQWRQAAGPCAPWTRTRFCPGRRRWRASGSRSNPPRPSSGAPSVRSSPICPTRWSSFSPARAGSTGKIVSRRTHEGDRELRLRWWGRFTLSAFSKIRNGNL